MSAEACRGWRERLGAYLTGRLTTQERAALEAHVDGCAECRSELRELAPVARGLDAADPERVLAGAEHPPPELEPRVVERIRDARHRRRRRRAALAVAAAAGSLAIAVTAIVVPGGSGQAGESIALTDGARGASGSASLLDREWGTEVHLRAAGLSAGRTYGLWFKDAGGRRVSGGTFRVPATGEIRMTLGVGLARRESVEIGVNEIGGGTVLRARLPAGG